MSKDELKLYVWRAVKRGNVQAMKLYLEMLTAERSPKADLLGAIDELAARRGAEVVG